MRQGVLQSLIQEAYRAGLEAGSIQSTQNSPTAVLRSPEIRGSKQKMAPQSGGAAQGDSSWRREMVEGLKAVERQVAASCGKACEASRRLERSLESATVIEVAAIER